MIIQVSNEDMRVLYDIATSHFKSLMRSKENNLVALEMGITLNSIEIRESYVRISFLKKTFQSYTVDICVLLIYEGEEIGKYTLVLDNQNNAVDDALVIY